MHFDPKTARGSVDCGRCLRARFRDMGEVCTLVLFIALLPCVLYSMHGEVECLVASFKLLLTVKANTQCTCSYIILTLQVRS